MRKTQIIGVLLVSMLLLLGACAPAVAPPTEPTPVPAEFEVIALDVQPQEVMGGETVEITAVVENIGGSEGTYTAILTVDEVIAETKEVTITAGSSKAITFSLVKDTPGTYEIGVGELSSSLTVKKELVIEEVELKYDDGIKEGQTAKGPGWGYLVHFSPPTTPFTIIKVKIYSRVGGTLPTTEPEVEIWDKDYKPLFTCQIPHTKFSREPSWVTVDVPSLVVNDAFCIVVHTNKGKEGGMLLYIDHGANKGSEMTKDGKIAEWDCGAPKETTNWMIRVIGTAMLPPDEEALEPTIPEPTAVASDYLVGAYYWISWDTQKVLTPFMDWKDSTFQPILGQYDSTDTSVINWHIKWATEHGISFFAVQCYETQLKAGFLKASFLPYIKFCFIAPHGLSVGLSARENLDHFIYQIDWMSKYFDNPQYLKINGRPVVFILIHYSSYQLEPDEESLFLSAIQDAKSHIKTTGQNPYLVATYATIGDGIFDRTSKKINEEFDAITTYGWSEAGGKSTPYDAMVSSYISLTQDWGRGAKEAGIDFIPNVMPGSDDSLSYQHGTRGWLIVRSESTPEKFQQMCEGVKQYIDPDNNMLMVTAWNEFAEGSVLEPTEENGFAYLDALRDVFCEEPPEGYPQNITLKE